MDIALACGADGVHLGDRDLPVAVARRLLGPGAIIGATARDPESGQARVRAGADYLGRGPDLRHHHQGRSARPHRAPPASAAVAAAVEVPVIAIAGISLERVPEVMASGAHGVAVVGAVSRAEDPRRATVDLLAAIEAA